MQHGPLRQPHTPQHEARGSSKPSVCNARMEDLSSGDGTILSCFHNFGPKPRAVPDADSMHVKKYWLREPAYNPHHLAWYTETTGTNGKRWKLAEVILQHNWQGTFQWLNDHFWMQLLLNSLSSQLRAACVSLLACLQGSKQLALQWKKAEGLRPRACVLWNIHASWACRQGNCFSKQTTTEARGD